VIPTAVDREREGTLPAHIDLDELIKCREAVPVPVADIDCYVLVRGGDGDGFDWHLLQVWTTERRGLGLDPQFGFKHHWGWPAGDAFDTATVADPDGSEPFDLDRSARDRFDDSADAQRAIALATLRSYGLTGRPCVTALCRRRCGADPRLSPPPAAARGRAAIAS